MFRLCFKLPFCLFTRDTSVIYRKAFFSYFIFMQLQKVEIHIYSNIHETSHVFMALTCLVLNLFDIV